MKRRAEERGRRGRLRRAVRAMATVVSVLVLGVTGAAVATPAHAGEDCTDLGFATYCGTAINAVDRPITIAYKWCGDEATGGPCPTSDPQQQIVLLAAGSQTPEDQDWDAVRVDAGCTYTGSTYTFPTGTTYWSFAGGSNGLWVKFNDLQQFKVESTACGSLQPRASYRVKNVNSQLCLVARNAAGENPVVQSTCGDWADQRWYIDTVGSSVRLRNYNSDKCVATRGTGESGAIATTCGTWADQLWTQENAGGVLRYRNVNSGLCLVARGNGESRAVQSTCGDWNDQKWFRPAW